MGEVARSKQRERIAVQCPNDFEERKGEFFKSMAM